MSGSPHEDALERATGRLAAGDPQSASEEERRAIEQILELESVLEASAAERRKVLADAAQAPPAPGEEEALRALSEHVASDSETRHVRRLRPFFLPVAATLLSAAVVLLIVLPLSERSDEPIDPGGLTLLGPESSALRFLPPEGTPSAPTLRWESTVDEGTRYRVDLTGTDSSDVLYSVQVAEPRWTPVGAELRTFRAARKVVVYALDENDAVRESTAPATQGTSTILDLLAPPAEEDSEGR